jgi:four helix bundle protein
MRDFRKLQVWEKSRRLTLAVYLATKAFPRDELYGLTSQLRRSSASVPSNIAEGCGRSGAKEFARFLDIAAGSAVELEYHLLLAQDLHYLDNATCSQLAARAREVKRMLTSLLQKLRPRRQNPEPES